MLPAGGYPVQAAKRFTEKSRARLRAEIEDAGGNEVFALGYCNEAGLVASLEIAARGNESSVLALDRFQDPSRPPDVLIHNHSSAFLVPSDNDLVIASRAAEGGMGSFIVDNQVEKVYVIAEPTLRQKRKELDPERLCAALEAGGAISRRLPSYEIRESQLDLMRLIIRGFNEDALVAAEAGTGVGKSFAYLLPSLVFALENNERIVLSTATIPLQQQLFDKDIPLVTAALNKKIKVVLIKGRGNYLCRRRLYDALREQSLFEEDDNDIRAILAWSEITKTGSRSDLSFMPPDDLWSRICSEVDLCMGMRCPERERCFVLALRKEAADARVLVVNHHLLFADIAARREGAGYDSTVVLPPYRRIVIDEAHKVEDAATSFFSKGFSRLGLYRQLGRLYHRRRGRQMGLLFRLPTITPQELDDAAEAIQKTRDAADALDEAGLDLCAEEGVFRLCPSREDRFLPVLIPALITLRKRIASLAGVLRSLVEFAEDEKDPATTTAADSDRNAVAWEVKAVLRRLETVAAVCGAFVEYGERPQEVMWLETHRSAVSGDDRGSWAVFTVTPLEVAPVLGTALFEPHKTVVCLSATLTVAGSGSGSQNPGAFAYWNRRSGITLVADREPLTGQFPSPFPYARSVLLAAPADAPLPDEDRYQAFVDQAVLKLTELAGGSTLVLFTSYEALKSAYAAAVPVLEKQGIRCLKQGDDDRSRLLGAFLADESSVLFGTDSFWEGVDAPGDTLRMVILCRLPFRTPRDPVFEARREALEKQGRNPFMELSLPEAVMKFKQGFGRLMRRSGDRGIVAVLDGRILRKRYGEFFIRSLPKTRTSFGEFSSVLRDTESFLFS
ncbi:ATP-dependent DNA helicase DinG [Treponema sp. TIM-1]|uniref:ATP-dependent DNA helicase n=1 Tax=Treponema sp. TIM-1 TaxID=2898417 RepID=UPI003980EA8B